MKPLIVLFSVFLISVLGLKIFRGKVNYSLSGRCALSAMFLFTAMGHFMFPHGMVEMLPDFVPYRTEIVYVTGIMEILFALGLLFPKFQKITAWSIIIFLILVLPANIYAAMHNIDYQIGRTDGAGLEYLWFRVPMQILLIFWVYFFGVKQKQNFIKSANFDVNLKKLLKTQ